MKADEIHTSLLIVSNGKTWWRHQMETFSALLAICAGNSNSPYKGQWRGALMFSLICAWISGWINNCEASDFRYYRTHYDVNVMWVKIICSNVNSIYTIKLPYFGETNICFITVTSLICFSKTYTPMLIQNAAVSEYITMNTSYAIVNFV